MVTPAETPTSASSGLSGALPVLLLGGFYILFSGGLISFNKFLMDEERFPHAMPLTACHMCMSLFLCCTYYCFNPAAYPGIPRTEGKRLHIFKLVIPIGVCFAVMLYGSNKAYAYCSVAFLQFMKESNVALVFTMSCIAGLQLMNRQKFVVIVWIILGSTMCVSGEMHFVLIGFLLQAMSQLAECMRVVMAELLLSGDLKLDPLTYTMFMAPVCLVILVLGSLVNYTPAVWQDFKIWWPYLLPNACMAFMLNLTIAKLIQECSAVGFILAGITKDVCLVVVQAWLVGEHISTMQWLSFVISVSGVFFWSYMKVCPDAGIVRSFEKSLGVPKSAQFMEKETEPLLPDKNV